MNEKDLQNNARNLRRNQTPAERLLWSKLRSRQLSAVKFRRQHPFRNHILDFYCPKAKLVIEVDGGQHADLENLKLDQLRSAALREKGIHVIRFWNDEVLNNLDDVILEIEMVLNERLAGSTEKA